jgi:hypothetical protein
MTQTTPKWGTPYPELTDGAAGYNQIALMATSLDDVAKDAPQGTLASRPVSTPASPGKVGRYYYATDYGVLFRDYGTGWSLASQGQFVSWGNPLPTNPVDGDVMDYSVDALYPGVIWRFRYRASSPSIYKWEYQGGGPSAFVLDAATYNQYSTSYFYGGPTLPIPIAGEWDFEYGALLWAGQQQGGVACMSPDITAAGAPNDNDAVYHNQIVYYNPGAFYINSQQGANGSRKKRATINSVRNVDMYYRLFSAVFTPATFQDRWIKATPVRVG